VVFTRYFDLAHNAFSNYREKRNQEVLARTSPLAVWCKKKTVIHHQQKISNSDKNKSQVEQWSAFFTSTFGHTVEDGQKQKFSLAN